MTRWTSRAATGLLTAALLLAGCAQPHGPVLGEWQGQPPGGNSTTTVATDLVLYGAPGDASGQYAITTTNLNPNQFNNHGTQQWGGAWTSTPGAVNGQPARFITLHDHLPDQIGGYALASDGRLHALGPNGSPDTSPAGALYTLSPVRPRN